MAYISWSRRLDPEGLITRPHASAGEAQAFASRVNRHTALQAQSTPRTYEQISLPDRHPGEEPPASFMFETETAALQHIAALQETDRRAGVARSYSVVSLPR